MLDDQLVDIVDAAKKAASEARQALSRRKETPAEMKPFILEQAVFVPKTSSVCPDTRPCYVGPEQGGLDIEQEYRAEARKFAAYIPDDDTARPVKVSCNRCDTGSSVALLLDVAKRGQNFPEAWRAASALANVAEFPELAPAVREAGAVPVLRSLSGQLPGSLQ
ncbi:unnamed protein product [Symbiodinium necroappetens]|uniref:Uncharacterized protein n=1 Tax=Symbiodinium necroappetens TaxID=1628268 RepID=A0A812R896_9DINO|nr:unnamed protein product [Symbiodinium necroappetens]